MKRIVYTLTPKTAFATALHGDTLFGQCCWAIVHLYGESRLRELLTGYTDNKPFMVLSDAIPQGFIARPSAPYHLLGYQSEDTKDRKDQKKKTWLPVRVLAKPLNQWSAFAQTEQEMLADSNLTGRYLINDEPQDHNSLNRLTGTTGNGDGFAPFQRQTFWYHPQIKLNLIVELDDNRLSIEELSEVLQWVGLSGYGKEASCGLGKFTIELDKTIRSELVEEQTNANAWLTLSTCAPQGLHWQPEHCYYQTFTRFGRHGDMAVHQRSPFKNPVLMAAPFAILTPKEMTQQRFTGQGLTGVSQTIEQTVQQGYAPVLPVKLEFEND